MTWVSAKASVCKALLGVGVFDGRGCFFCGVEKFTMVVNVSIPSGVGCR